MAAEKNIQMKSLAVEKNFDDGKTKK